MNARQKCRFRGGQVRVRSAVVAAVLLSQIALQPAIATATQRSEICRTTKSSSHRSRWRNTLLSASAGVLGVFGLGVFHDANQIQVGWPFAEGVSCQQTTIGPELRIPKKGPARISPGDDLAVRVGTPVKFSCDRSLGYGLLGTEPCTAKVTYAGRHGANSSSGYGKLVRVTTYQRDGRTPDWRFGYGHLDEISVRKDQPATRGLDLGTSGNTGSSSGPHLDFTAARWNGERFVHVPPSRVLEIPESCPPDPNNISDRRSRLGFLFQKFDVKVETLPKRLLTLLVGEER